MQSTRASARYRDSNERVNPTDTGCTGSLMQHYATVGVEKSDCNFHDLGGVGLGILADQASKDRNNQVELQYGVVAIVIQLSTMSSRGTGTLATSGLYFETVVPPDPRGTILVSHGYAEHCGRYREVTDELAKHRWASLAYDVRGHGHSPGRRGHIDRFGEYLQDFEEAKQQARSLSQGPLIGFCHSHGALITLSAIVSGSVGFDSLVISSPFLGLKVHVNPLKKAVGRIASQVWPTLTLPAPLTVDILTSDKGKQAERASDKLCFEVATARWFTEARQAQVAVLRNASKIKLPSLWVIAGSDQLADAAVSQAFAGQVANADVQMYPTMQHEVLNETQRSTVYQRVTTFLAKR
jgi:alpha-beta hydrolase superfamily lysophospholipase